MTYYIDQHLKRSKLMFNNVNFTGRETLLTAPIKKIAQPVEEFVADGAILKDTAEKVTNTVEKIATEEAAKLNEAYRAAHAPYTVKKAVPEAEIFEQAYILWAV